MLCRSVANKLVGPLNEPLHVRRVGVSTVVLSPCQLAAQKALVHRGRFRSSVVAFDLEALGAEQRIYAACVHSGHETPLVVEPLGIAFLRDSVADEGETRGAEGNECIG